MILSHPVLVVAVMAACYGSGFGTALVIGHLARIDWPWRIVMFFVLAVVFSGPAVHVFEAKGYIYVP
jgi:hypothetical protein